MNRDWKKFKIFILYLLLIAGGFWHVLNVFQDLMAVSASPLIIGLGIWLLLENWNSIRKENQSGKKKSQNSNSFLGWSVMVIILTIIIEGIGVKTGIIFGNYTYGTNLPPYLSGVPVAIGFAWLMMLLSSLPLAERIMVFFKGEKIVYTAVLAASLMTLFDYFMEPAAVKLNYWTWSAAEIPLQNYLAWFGISFLLVISGKRFLLLPPKTSPLGIHSYIAQLLYFFLVSIS
jgi:putative membrane protein